MLKSTLKTAYCGLFFCFVKNKCVFFVIAPKITVVQKLMLIFWGVMKVVTKKFKSGERYVFLLDDEGVPDFWVTHFVTQNLRMDKAATTIRQYLKSIKHLKVWEAINKRDLLEEIYEGKVPSLNDIKKIKTHCTYQVKGLKEKKKTNVVEMSEFSDSKPKDIPTVLKSQYVSRIAHIAEYLHFCGTERVKKKPSAANLIEALDKMKEQLKSGLPKVRLKGNRRMPDEADIADDAIEDFLAVAHPNSENNPFGEGARLRNYLIVRILYETGCRRAELTALRIGDIGTDTDYPTLTVERRHNSKDDNRVDEPTAKTLGGELYISEELRDLLNFYIRNNRMQTKKGRFNPFIFVAHKGKEGSHEEGDAINHQTINDVLNKIKKVNSERFWGITPHTFRHYFNDQLSQLIDAEKEAVKKEVARLESEGKYKEAKFYEHENLITEQRELEIRAYMNRHSDEKSGQYYLGRTNKKRVKAIRKKMLAKLEGYYYGS
jgi:integrase